MLMENVTVACVQQRMGIPPTSQEFKAEARRFLRQAQAKGAQLVIFPELAGVMLAPPLISSLKLGLVKRADRGGRPQAGFLSRGMGRVAGTAAGALGGGFRGSLQRLLKKKSDALFDVYAETFGSLAQEFATAILGGSVYLYDAETEMVRNRAFLFDADGEVLGHQDKLNLASEEQELASPGADLAVIETWFGRVGVLVGRDAMYPELARLYAVQGADLLVGIAASPGLAQANAIRSAMALRAEENQVYAAASFLLGPNYLGRENAEEYLGRSALLAPISLTKGGNGVLVEVGTIRTEGLIAADLDVEALNGLWETSRFRPRREMHLGNLGPVLAEMYRDGLTIEQAMERRIAGPVEPAPEAVAGPGGFRPVFPVEPAAELPEIEPESTTGPEPEALPPPAQSEVGEE
jgi:predicted amidohydrolase